MIAVIGFGPSGMSFLHAVDHRRKQLEEEGNTAALAELPDVTCFERSVSIICNLLQQFELICILYATLIILQSMLHFCV